MLANSSQLRHPFRSKHCAFSNSCCLHLQSGEIFFIISIILQIRNVFTNVILTLGGKMDNNQWQK